MAYYTTDEKTTFKRTIIALLKLPTILVRVYKKSIGPTSDKNLKYLSWKTAKDDHNIIEQIIDTHKAKLFLCRNVTSQDIFKKVFLWMLPKKFKRGIRGFKY